MATIPPADGGDGGLHRAVHGAQIARRHNVKACKEVAHKVHPHPGVGVLRHLHRVFAVEPAYKGIGQAEHCGVQHRRQHQHRAAAQQQQFPRPGVVVLAVAAAHQRLYALCHTVEDGGSHQRKVCHHAVGCYAHVACQTQQQKVEHRGGHAGGKLAHKAGDAQLTALRQQPCRGQLPHELQGVFLF